MNKDYFFNSSEVISSLAKQSEKLDLMATGIQNCFKSGNKILLAGNGGSASDAQHFAGELTCTYKNPNRIGFPAIPLANNPSSITAWSNDFDVLDFYQRQVHALGKENDILFLISTGGGEREKGYSINLIRAADYALKNNIYVYSLVGKSGGELEKISSIFIKVESDVTSHIQESHITIIHYLCETLENLEV